VSRTKLLSLAFLLSLLVLWSVSAPAQQYPDSRPLASWQVWDVTEYEEPEWLLLDRNEDGLIDYAVRLAENGNKLREALDFNHDGFMDDFYVYQNDVLQREEIDSNFDQQIDIWIFMHRGVYIQMWERDNDFDGVIDERADYENPQP
jgi:hypothetical protein